MIKAFQHATANVYYTKSNHHRTMNQLDLSRLTERERKTYAEGMAIVKRKLEAARRADVTRKAEVADRNAASLVNRMGSHLAKTCFGAVDPVTKRLEAIADRAARKALSRLAASPKAASPKAPDSKPTARKEFSKRTVHRFCMGSLFGGAFS